jgi:hypothetical protein
MREVKIARLHRIPSCPTRMRERGGDRKVEFEKKLEALKNKVIELRDLNKKIL